MSIELGLPEPLKKGTSPAAPLNMRLMLARGQLPLGIKDRLATLVLLAGDPEAEVTEAVDHAWRTIDDELLLRALGDHGLHPELLDAVAHHRGRSAGIALLVLSHVNLTARTLLRFIHSDDAAVLDLVGQNQRLLLEVAEEAVAILDNPILETGLKGRLQSLFGVTPEAEEGQHGGDGGDSALSDAESVLDQLPDELYDDDAEVDDGGFDDAALMREGVDSTNVFQLIQKMSISEKIRLATLGNKAARKLLARDSNKLVVMAVIRSPKIREDEVTAMLQNRTIADEVITYVLTRKDWLKNYPVRLALVQNPRTPLVRAVRLLETLQEKDLRSIMKSRNVPQNVSANARRVLLRRKKV